MSRLFSRFLAAALAFAVALPGWAQGEAPTFSKERLDQLLAPVALYPDSLLTQVLMAATYPAQVAEAVAWSAAHPNDKGDAAVTKADGQGWEPAVTSLVAFPQVLATMGQKPEWVQELGDAFLAQPNDTMDAVQRLRRAAQNAGMLKSTEQQKVVIENPTPQQSVIVIQPAQPQVVYVPTYNPTVVYGAWPYPSYPPYYIPPPPGYYFGSALMTGLAFGAGLAITNSLWGGYNWGRNDVNINVNRYNNVNVNRKLDVNQTNFTHNSAGRKGVPYRDAKVDQKYGKNVAGKDARNDYRGRDANDAKRDAARDTMAQRTNDPKTREQLAAGRAPTGPGARIARRSTRTGPWPGRPGPHGSRQGPAGRRRAATARTARRRLATGQAMPRGRAGQSRQRLARCRRRQGRARPDRPRTGQPQRGGQTGGRSGRSPTPGRRHRQPGRHRVPRRGGGGGARAGAHRGVDHGALPSSVRFRGHPWLAHSFVPWLRCAWP